MVIEMSMQTSPAKSKRARILVVDDELGPRESLRHILSPIYQVLLAADGEEALACFEREKPDMVISDIRMPRMDGIILMKEIKERDPDVPFILLTGFGTLKAAREALQTGAFDFISKPYDVDDIRQVARRALEDSRAKQANQRMLSQLRTTNAQLSRSLQMLSQRASIGDLTAEIIHDLNNPIAGVQGYVELLEVTLMQQPGFAESEEKEFMDAIKEEAGRCLDLIDRFLEYVRSTGPRWSRVSIDSLIEKVISLFATKLRRQEVELELALVPEIPVGWVQPTPFQQVFHNLIMNALHALEECTSPPHLRISTAYLPSCHSLNGISGIEVTVEDNGPGIPVEDREEVFRRFFTTKSPGKGTGLGLAICRRIVAEHGGIIEAGESEDLGGARFSIWLPIYEDPPGTPLS